MTISRISVADVSIIEIRIIIVDPSGMPSQGPERMLGVVRVQQVGGSTFTVTIPKTVREIVHLRKGQLMYVKVEGKHRIIYEPVR